MNNEKIRAALKAKIAAERQKKRRQQTWRFLITVMVFLTIAILMLPAVHAKYVSYLETLQPVGLDSVTNTDLVEALYPVGSIYISADDTDPGAVFGGTWEILSSGYCLVSEGDAYEILDIGGTSSSTRSATVSGTANGIGGPVSLSGTATAVGKSQSLSASITGVNGSLSASGSLTVQTTNLPSHSHTIPSHSHSFPSHSHTFLYRNYKNHWPNGSGNTSSTVDDLRNYWRGNNSIGDNGRPTGNPANDSGDANVANTDSAGTGPAAKSVTSTGTASGLSGSATLISASVGYSGTASASGQAANLSGIVSGAVSGTDNTMQPYLVVKMWQRAA